MRALADVAVALVAALHVGFFVLEAVLWKRSAGRRVFGLPRELVDAAAPLAANQGLYNLFLAAGLAWSLLPGSPGLPVRLFFLACVVVAGVFGAVTAKRTILYVQALPGLLALALSLAA